MAFVHAEVLGPLVSLGSDKILPRMTKALLQGFALDASYTRSFNSQLLLGLSDNSLSLPAHYNWPQ
jgi:hypothetical protein